MDPPLAEVSESIGRESRDEHLSHCLLFLLFKFKFGILLGFRFPPLIILADKSLDLHSLSFELVTPELTGIYLLSQICGLFVLLRPFLRCLAQYLTLG